MRPRGAPLAGQASAPMKPSSHHHEIEAALRSLDVHWPPRDQFTLMALVAEARAVDWDFAT
jgi:hypothetical protein